MARLPEVEPLGDVRWARIEQSLMQRLDELPSAEPKPSPSREPVRASAFGGRTRAWPVALVATFAVSVAAAVALRVTSPYMNVSTSRVVTEASASHVTIAENSLDVSPESGIEIREEERATVLTLERGEVSLHVAPREKERPFVVQAGDVQVRVVGTEFTVRRVGVGATVVVRRGVVEVREHGELALVRAGERWPSDVTSSSASPAGVTPTSPSLPTPAPLLAATPAPTPVTAATPTFPAATPAAAATPLTAPVSRATARRRPAPAPDPAPDLSPPPTPQDVTPPPTPEPSAQSKYETAARLERTDPARALRLYVDLATGSDAWAQNALYAAGRLQADRGARADAARLLEEYLRRFPRGSNAQDARALRESLR